MIPSSGSRSPWGLIATTTRWAEGILRVTPVRGGEGLWLSPERNAQVPECLRLPTGWYSGEVEWSRVFLSFPEVFQVQNTARITLAMYSPAVYADFTRYEASI